MVNAKAKPRQPTVLLVEDDDAIRDAFTYLLVEEGFLVLGARSGHDAIGMVRVPLSPIDVAVLDINLPDVSGIDLCARIRETHPDLPVIVCTGESDSTIMTGLASLGISRYFLKPVSPAEILAAVRSVVASFSASR